MSALTDKNRRKAEERLLDLITIKCKDCKDTVQFEIEYRPNYCDNCGRKFNRS